MELSFVLELPLLFFSVIVHEYAHGRVALAFGDDTARLMGRLSFNPLPHIDPVGTVLIPALCFFTRAPMFGWAKPVPVNTQRLSSQPLSLFLVSAVGPGSNLALACVGALGGRALRKFGIEAAFVPMLVRALNFFIITNLYLAVFNLLPVHPLDGSKVAAALLPWSYRRAFEQFGEKFGFYVIMLLMFTGLFGRILSPVVYLLYSLLIGG